MYSLIFIYAFIAGMYFKHNDKMGGWFTGLIVAIFWPVVAILWIIGSILVYMDDKNYEQ